MKFHQELAINEKSILLLYLEYFEKGRRNFEWNVLQEISNKVHCFVVSSSTYWAIKLLSIPVSLEHTINSQSSRLSRKWKNFSFFYEKCSLLMNSFNIWVESDFKLRFQYTSRSFAFSTWFIFWEKSIFSIYIEIILDFFLGKSKKAEHFTPASLEKPLLSWLLLCWVTFFNLCSSICIFLTLFLSPLLTLPFTLSWFEILKLCYRWDK